MPGEPEYGPEVELGRVDADAPKGAPFTGLEERKMCRRGLVLTC